MSIRFLNARRQGVALVLGVPPHQGGSLEVRDLGAGGFTTVHVTGAADGFLQLDLPADYVDHWDRGMHCGCTPLGAA